MRSVSTFQQLPQLPPAPQQSFDEIDNSLYVHQYLVVDVETAAFDPATEVTDVHPEVSSTFLNKITDFGPVLSAKAFYMFDRIVERRYTENV